MAENNQTEEKKKSRIGLILLIVGVFAGMIYLIYAVVKPKPQFDKRDWKASEALQVTPKKAEVSIQGRVRTTHAFSDSEKKIYAKYLEKAREYQASGDQATSFEEKEKKYMLALKELKKIRKKRPGIIGKKRGIISQIIDSMVKVSTLHINIGDTREKLIKVLGKAEREIDSIKFMPAGTVKELYYFDHGVMISIYEDTVFAIEIKSNFPGSYYGVRMGDSFDKISSLFEGRKIEIEGTNFGYECEEWNFNFLFIDNDEQVDALKLLNKEVYEELTSSESDY